MIGPSLFKCSKIHFQSASCADAGMIQSGHSPGFTIRGGGPLGGAVRNVNFEGKNYV